VSRVFDELERLWVALASGSPPLALSGAGTLGRLRNRLSRRWPSPEQVRALFPEMGARAAARAAWRIGGLEARNRAWVENLRRSGLDPLRPLVRTPPALAALRPPLLLGTFHVGAVHALGPALERLPAAVLGLRHGPFYEVRPPLALATTEGDAQQRAALFQRLLAHLTGGGFVAMALDAVPGTGLPVSCLGRTLELARGPFALARLAGVPLVPLVGRWRRGSVEVVLGEALPQPLGSGAASGAAEWESALAASAGLWLERYLRASPTELGLGLLRTLLGPDL
jgi:hypothetical protein